MSRVGRKPIPIPKGVEVSVTTDAVEVKGPKGRLATQIPAGITFRRKDGILVAERQRDEDAALHGLARALVANSVRGVTEGFRRELDVVGVGYKAEVKGKVLFLSLGYSHPIEFPIPPDIEIKVDRQNKTIPQYQTTISISGADRQLVGQLAADLRALRRPDAYKGKGVRYSDEKLKLKPGKTGK